MAKERLFYTGSVNIIGDPRPSGLDHRVYACVSLHDGMSLVKGTGRGCYATFATLTAQLGCDAGDLSRSLKRLVAWGYLTEERQTDRRRKTYRVRFDSRETWANAQQSAAPQEGEIVGSERTGNGGIPPQTGQHYISLKGLDSSEEEKLNSVETAHRASATRVMEEDDRDSGSHSNGERDRAEARLGGEDCVSLFALLPQRWRELDTGAQLASLERVLRQVEKDGKPIEPGEVAEFGAWLTNVHEIHCCDPGSDPDSPIGNRALRLLEQWPDWSENW